MRDLVSLLYGADWTRLRLAADVTASRDADLDRTRYGTDATVSGRFGETAAGRARVGDGHGSAGHAYGPVHAAD